jgi:hypothetical protein
MNQPSEGLSPTRGAADWEREPYPPREGFTFDQVKTAVAEKLRAA